MSASTYSVTTAATGLDRSPQVVTVQLNSSDSTVITLACLGGDLSASELTFIASGAAQVVNMTPTLGRVGGTVVITSINSTGLDDPWPPPTVTVAPKPRHRSGSRNPGRGYS